MVRGVAVLCLAALVIGGTEASRIQAEQKARGNSMIAKVIQMLGEEKDKIKADLAAEAKVTAEYVQWCDDTQTELSYGIKTAKSKIEDLTATIEDNTAQITSLDEELAELGNEIAKRQTEMEESIAIRKAENEEFLKAEKEQVATVEELEQMGIALKQQMEAFRATPAPVTEEEAAPAALVQQGSFDALLQVSSRKATEGIDFAKMKKVLTALVNTMWVDPESKKALDTLNENGAFVQEDPAAPAGPGADAVAAQDQANQDNLAAFEGLKGKAEESLQKQRDEEAKKQADHNIQVMSLKQAIALAENDVDDAKKNRAQLAEEKAQAENELGEVEASKAADEKSLEETTRECEATAKAWATRQEEAKAEMAAIEKAKEILAERVTVLIQVKVSEEPDLSGDALKVRAKTQKTRQALVDHFRNLGNKIHSLAMLNLVSVATSDPMEQVKNLLKDLITKLEKEAAEAASLHAFCQEEKEKTTAALKKKDMELDKLNARLEKAQTTKKELEEDIATNSEEIAAIDKTNAEATKLRNEEHENFAKVDNDFRQAADAVDDAIDALKEYYGDAFFLQTDSETDATSTSGDSAPPTYGGAKKDSAGGIIGILETMGEEFRKTVKENDATEREALKAYEKLMNENKVAKSTKEATIKGAESQIKSLSVSLQDNGEDLKMVTKEKDAVLEYVEKLKPQCQGRVVPYAERKAKMEAEINGLKEGLAILEEESPSGAFSFMQIRQH